MMQHYLKGLFLLLLFFGLYSCSSTKHLKENEFLIVPRGVEHRPVAAEEVSIMLFEPATTVNTGNAPGKLTKENLTKI